MTCPKKVYQSRKEAKKAMKDMQKRGIKLTDVYYCSDCSGWHVTSMEKRRSRSLTRKLRRK